MKEFENAICERIAKLLTERASVLVAIDGRCGAGKTTLAARLAARFCANVLHMDDFFLRPEQRTKARLSEPGGNVDYERFYRTVLTPLARGEAFRYVPYDCHTGTFCAPVAVPPRAVNIVEGAYSCHPRFGDMYDLTVFLSIDAREQLSRIQARNGEAAAIRFRDVWIPLEERYFSLCGVEARADLVYRVPDSAAKGEV